MDVIEAILARHSVRDFSPDPISRETVLKILETAVHSPSGGNSQPWNLYIAGGKILENIRQAYIARGEKEIPGKPELPSIPPPQWPPKLADRMKQIAGERLKLLKIDPQDKAAMKAYMSRTSRLWGAPVVIVLCMDRTFTPSTALDIGLISQTIMLVAKNYGVDSLIASGFVAHPDNLRKELEIPENLMIVTGIGLGYPDPKSILNTYRSPRVPVNEVAVLKGF